MKKYAMPILAALLAVALIAVSVTFSNTVQEKDRLIADATALQTSTDATLADTQAKLTETEGKLAETEGTLASTQATLTETEGKLAETEAALAEAQAEPAVEETGLKASDIVGSWKCYGAKVGNQTVLAAAMGVEATMVFYEDGRCTLDTGEGPVNGKWSITNGKFMVDASEAELIDGQMYVKMDGGSLIFVRK